MTYNSREESEQLGEPVELFKFVYGTSILGYTDQDEEYPLLSTIYQPATITRSAIEESAELARNNLTLTVARDLPIADLFRVQPPSEEVSLTVFRVHRNDPDQESVSLWEGRVLNAQWMGEKVELYCENLFTSFKRKGLRRVYQKGCPYVLYDPDTCRVSKAAFKEDCVIATYDGAVTLTSPDFSAKPDEYFQKGFFDFEYEDDKFERREIRTHVGDTITISYPIYRPMVGVTIEAYPGCNHRKGTGGDCNEKFSNHLNYGGFVDIPILNPFNTTTGI